MTNRVLLPLVTAVLAALAGATGGWMLAWAAGGAVTAHVDRCYRYYGPVETAHARCEGYWRRRGSPGARGPLLGVPVAPGARLVDPGRDPADLGYELDRRAFPETVFVTLRGDGGVVVPRTHLVAGPAAALAAMGCLATLGLSRRRDREP